MPGNEQYTLSDRLAIALACLAGIMAIILFFVEKNRLSIVLLLAAMVVLAVYPALHLFKKPLLRSLFIGLFASGAIGFGFFQWPKTPPATVQTVPAPAPPTIAAVQKQVSDRLPAPNAKPVPAQSKDSRLSETAMRLAANIQGLAQDWATEQLKIDGANDVTDQQRKSMSETWARKVMAEYDTKYKEDARTVRDMLLEKLPAATDSLAMNDAYENEINPSLLRVIASDLERLAKLVQGSGSVPRIQ